jgi:rRNA small subunit pseudouridine methyltransferase Nep1
MNKLILVFSETALELIPSEIQSNPIIAEEASKRHKKANAMVLDSNKHYLPMRSLPDFEKRGRPDILHFSLLTALESLANKNHLVENVLIHTCDNKILQINPETRLPRNYSRFEGLMEQALLGKSTDLIKFEGVASFGDFFKSKFKNSTSAIYFFNELGKQLQIKQFSNLLSQSKTADPSSPIVLVFGCFPHGNFSDSIRKYLLEHGGSEVKFGSETLTVWTLVGLALNSYESEAGL